MCRKAQFIFLALFVFQTPFILHSQHWNNLFVASATGVNEGVGVSYTKSGSLFFAGNHRGAFDYFSFNLEGSSFQKGFWGKQTTLGSVSWIKTISGNKDVFVTGVETFKQAVAVSGYYVDSLFIEQDTLVNSLQKGIFIAMYDTSGNYYYTIHPDVNSATVFDMAFDSEGNLVVTGSFFLGFDFEDYSISSPLGMSMFLFKYDVFESELMWLTMSEGTGTSGSGVSVDSNNNICVAGSYGDETSIQGVSLENNNGNHNFYLAKFSPGGILEWVETIIGLGQVHGADVRMNSAGESYVAGDFQMSIDSLNGAIIMSEGNANAFVGKYDVNGNLLWIQRIGGSNQDNGVSIVLDSNETPLILFDSSVEANINGISLEPHGFLEPLILKLHPNDGSYVWHKRITALENSGTVNGLSIAVSGNRIAVTGKNRTGLEFQEQLFPAPNFSEFYVATFIDTLFIEVEDTVVNDILNLESLIYVNVFPNPSKDSFRFVSSDANIDEILVYGLNGELIFHDFPTEKEYVLTTNLEEGYYLVKLRINQSETVLKLLKL